MNLISMRLCHSYMATYTLFCSPLAGPHTLSIPTEFTFSGSRVDGSSRTIIDEPDPTGEGEVRIHTVAIMIIQPQDF